MKLWLREGLEMACQHGHADIADMLIKHGADPSSLSGSQLVKHDLDVVPTDEQLTDIPEGHYLRKNYYNAIEKRSAGTP